MVFYEHSATPVYPLLVDTSLYNTGATLTEVSLSGTLANISPPTLVEEVVWQNVVGATASGNSVTATTEGWTAGASSSQSITSGDAAVEFTAAETNTHRMCGLSSGDANQHYTDIDYAIYLTNAGTILVYEGGRYIGEYGGYAAGDRFGVSIEGNTVKYSKNSRVFHAHTAGVQYPLVADTSFGNAGATIANAVLRRGGAGGGTGGSTTSRANIEWLVTDQLGTPRMVIAESGSLSSVKRHDYLPFGEEIGEGVGGRTTNQGYGQPDGVRNRFTGKERDAETGLDYFMARYLSSSQGRFTSSDPIILSAARLNDPQQLNLYAYTRNNPLKFIDPFGEDIETTGVDLDRQRHAAAVSRQTGLKLKAEGNKVVFDGAAPNRKDLKEAALQIYDAIQSDKVVRIDLVEHDGNVDFGGPFKLDADDNPTTAGAHKIDFGDIDQANGAKLKDFNENTIVLHETLEAIAIQKDGANFDQAHAAANVYAPGLKPAGQGRQVNLSSTFGIILNYIPYEVDRPSGSKLTVTTSVTTLRSTIQAPTSGNLREFMKFRATNPIHIVGVTGKQ